MTYFTGGEGNDEVDFVIRRNRPATGLEIKSGRTQRAPSMAVFQRKMNPDKVLLVGNSGIPWVDFLGADISTRF